MGLITNCDGTRICKAGVDDDELAEFGKTNPRDLEAE